MFHAIFSFSQFLKNYDNNKDEENINYYDLIRIFTSGLCFREEKTEESISCPVKDMAGIRALVEAMSLSRINLVR